MIEQLKEYFYRLEKHDKALPMSYSKGNTLIKCPRKYKKQYIEYKKGGEPYDPIPGKVGNYLHRVLEQCVKRGDWYGYEPDIIDFDYVWVYSHKGLTLQEYNQACEQRYETEAVCNRIIDLIKRKELIAKPETKIRMTKNCDIFSDLAYKSCAFTGYIDLVAITPGHKHALLLDYKSHKRTSENQEEANLQTSIYATLSFMKFPSLESVQPGSVFIPEEDDSNRFVLEEKVYRDNINEASKPLMKFFDDIAEILDKGEFEPRKNKLCNYCNYIHDCKLHKK